jgi:hypothetical protein
MAARTVFITTAPNTSTPGQRSLVTTEDLFLAPGTSWFGVISVLGSETMAG